MAEAQSKAIRIPVADAELGEPEVEAVAEVLRSRWLTAGAVCARFEEEFRKLCGGANVLAVTNCTAALHMAYLALDVRPGDEVLVPTLSFVATANAARLTGAVPVFVDCTSESDFNVDPVELERRIGPRTAAIAVVHYGGYPCAMDDVKRIAARHGLPIVEDCAHAPGGTLHGVPVGTLGDVGCFSFYVTKNVVTGEGGMAITGSRALADRMRTLALHGMTKDAWRRFSDKGYVHYDVVDAGFKYNMMDLQAAIGIHQLARVERTLERRAEIWHAYDEAFRDLPVFVPAAPAPDTRHAHHLYTLLIDVDHVAVTRDDFLERMTQQKIGVGVHYRAVHLHPFYQERYGYRTGQLPAAEWVSERTVSLPLSPKLDPGDVADVIEAVRRSLGA